jgi:hypothetical protein
MNYVKKIYPLFVFLLAFNMAPLSAQGTDQGAGKNALRQLGSEYQDEYRGMSDLAPIRAKIPMTSKLATLEQMTDNSKPTKAEKKALEAYSELRKKYDAKDIEITNQYWPYIVSVRREFHRNLEELLAELYVGKVTYGQFNKRRKEISDNFQTKVDALNHERRANIESKRQVNQQNAQKEATCSRLRAQLQQRIEAQSSFANRMADAAAWDPGYRNSTTASLSARASQKAQEQEQINQLQQNIINYCGSL